MERTAGQLAAIADQCGAKLSFILVSEVHPDDLPEKMSAEELVDYRADRVRQFMGPDVAVYFDIDHQSERTLEFSRLNVLYLEDGWQLYRMTPPGCEGRHWHGVNPFLSWWRMTHPPRT